MPAPATFEDTVELLRRAKGGDEACLGRVLERYRDRLLGRIQLMLGGGARHVAESGDFLHDVFLKILDRFDGFEVRDEGAFLRWATQIARNGIRDDLCRRRETALETMASESGIWPPATASGDTPSREAVRSERIAELVEALCELDETPRKIVELRHFEGLPFAEIGRRLDRSENAVQLLHTRVILKLGQRLRPLHPEADGG